jgi:LPXTG-motif cell wall-anchored protein
MELNAKIRKLGLTWIALSLVLAGVLGFAGVASADGHQGRVRAVHASPDAPAVDVLVDGNKAFANVEFKGISDYAALDEGDYNVKVVPAGATEPAVIDANVSVGGGKDYTVVALGMLDGIEPLVLEDNNAAPAEGKAHVRFVHASPDAPAVDIAVANGPVLFSNVAFKGVGEYLPVDAGAYDLDVKVHGTDDVALSVPGVTFDEGTVYTVFAVGLAAGEPALQALPSVDAAHGSTMTDASQEMPENLPKTGTEDTLPIVMAIAAVSVLSGLALRRASVVVRR